MESAGLASLGQGMVGWLQRWLARPSQVAQESSTAAGGYGQHSEWL